MNILTTGRTFTPPTMAPLANDLSLVDDTTLQEVAAEGDLAITGQYPGQTVDQFRFSHAPALFDGRALRSDLLEFAAEHSFAIKAAMIGAVIVAGLVGDAIQTPGFEFTPALAGLGDLFRGLFGGNKTATSEPPDWKIRKTARLIGEKLSGRPKSIYQDIGPGEETARNDLIKRLLTTGASEDKVASALANVFHMSGKNRATVFGATGQLLATEGMNTDDVSMVQFITETADKMSGNTPVAFKAVPGLVLGGLTLPDIATLFERAGKYRGADSFDTAVAKAAKALGGKFIEACKTFIEQFEREEARQAQALAFNAGLEARAASASAVPFAANDPEVEKAGALLNEVRQLASRITRAEDRDTVYREVVPRLEEIYEHISKIFKDIESGRSAEPHVEALRQYAMAWLITADNLHRYYLPSDPYTARKLFWKMVFESVNVLDKEMSQIIPNYDTTLNDLVGSFFTREGHHRHDDFADLENGNFIEYLNKLIARGLVPEGGKYEGVLPLPDERWPDGGSMYVSDILRPAYDAIARGLHINDNGAMLAGLSKVFMQYQILRACYPSMPIDFVLCAVHKNLDSPSLVLRTGNRALYETVDIVFSSLHRSANRWLATLPSDKLEKYHRQITRDFPEAVLFRQGLEQDIDRKAIEQVLHFSEGGEDLIMHIGVQNDLEFVKESLRHLSANGKVVIVDNDGRAFESFVEDSEIRGALESKKLETATMDAYGSDFGEMYKGQVNRLYLLHPHGDPIPTVRKIMAPDGLVIMQEDERPPMSNYTSKRRLFNSGEFEKLAGYANGPAWFKTNTAMNILHGAGIHLLVARRKKEEYFETHTSSIGSFSFYVTNTN